VSWQALSMELSSTSGEVGHGGLHRACGGATRVQRGPAGNMGHIPWIGRRLRLWVGTNIIVSRD
jgi:hypothetical protein